MVSIRACHHDSEFARDPGSIPGREEFLPTSFEPFSSFFCSGVAKGRTFVESTAWLCRLWMVVHSSVSPAQSVAAFLMKRRVIDVGLKILNQDSIRWLFELEARRV